MICCLVGAFLLSQLLVVWRRVGAFLRSLSIGLAICGAVFLAVGIIEWQVGSPSSMLVRLCTGDGANAFVRIPLTAQNTATTSQIIGK